ncbi:hypothetical protein JOB18_033401 [Solea senegalensis]|uniref:Uncharacterized protein n=1 Tax=Solea senegalensis TaxID=28829 RepID=A0AAV6T0Q7_SOLSE|nr:hypothetical protein JOB18_033401 [Solea senegalensis]
MSVTEKKPCGTNNTFQQYLLCCYKDTTNQKIAAVTMAAFNKARNGDTQTHTVMKMELHYGRSTTTTNI